MTYPYSGGVPSAGAVATAIDSNISRLVNDLQAFKLLATTGSFNSLAAMQVYLTMTSVRVFVETNKTTPGLSTAIVALFPTRPTLNPETEWTAVRAALDPCITWFKTNLVKDAAGRPVFYQFKVGTDELEGFTLTPGSTLNNQLLAQVNAVLATLG